MCAGMGGGGEGVWQMRRGRPKGAFLWSGVNWAPNSLWPVSRIEFKRAGHTRAWGQHGSCGDVTQEMLAGWAPIPSPAGLQLGFNGQMWNALGVWSRKSVFKAAGSFWLSKKTFHGQFSPELADSGGVRWQRRLTKPYKASCAGSLGIIPQFSLKMMQRRISRSLALFGIWGKVGGKKNHLTRGSLIFCAYGSCKYISNWGHMGRKYICVLDVDICKIVLKYMYTSLCLCVCYSYLFTCLPLYLFIYSLIYIS